MASRSKLLWIINVGEFSLGPNVQLFCLWALWVSMSKLHDVAVAPPLQTVSRRDERRIYDRRPDRAWRNPHYGDRAASVESRCFTRKQGPEITASAGALSSNSAGLTQELQHLTSKSPPAGVSSCGRPSSRPRKILERITRAREFKGDQSHAGSDRAQRERPPWPENMRESATLFGEPARLQVLRACERRQ